MEVLFKRCAGVKDVEWLSVFMRFGLFKTGISLEDAIA